MKRLCHCGQCPYCISFEREEARQCARDNLVMRRQRAAEPFAPCLRQSCLREPRPAIRVHTRSMGVAPGGEA